METIWIKNPKNLLTFYDSFSIFTNNNPYNAFIRSLIMSGFFFFLFKRRKWFYICLIGILITTIIGYINEEKETIEEVNCRKATVDNPMGNLLPLSKDPHLSACKDEDYTDKLFDGHYRDPNDHINDATMRQFITMPVTSIHDKRDEFGEFIMNGYENEFKSCKNDGFQCERYRDIRFDFE